jgi:hypothetical protein
LLTTAKSAVTRIFHGCSAVEIRFIMNLAS